MKMPEGIKKGLEYIATTDVTHKAELAKCGLPYAYAEDIASDALALIQQLEAKLAEYEKPLAPMTVDSIARNTRFLLSCWIETKTNMWPDVLDRDSVGNFGKIDNHERVTVHYLMDAEYGKTWRCWPRRPTYDERKAAKWDD